MFNGMSWGSMWFGWFFWIVILGVIIFLIVRLSQQNNSRQSTPQPPHQNETALDILKKRYAKGEITKEEFDKMKNDLS